MGIFDSESEDEVKISPDEKDSVEESRLRDEVETEIVGDEKDSGNISLKDVHRQNERIIELLQELTGEDEDEIQSGGDLNGVL